MSALQKRNPAEGAAGDNSYLSNLPASHTENHGDWQRLGDVAANVVASTALRREHWIARQCRVSADMAHAIASVAFEEERS